MPQASSVTLVIAGRQPVSFVSSEFASAAVDGLPHELPMLGLTTAKWYLASGAPWTERDEATYVSFPLTMLHFSCMRLAGATPQAVENIEQAATSLQLGLARLGETVPSENRSALTCRIVAQLGILETSLIGLAQVQRGQRRRQDAQQLAEDAAATTNIVFELQEEAKALRDVA